MPSPKIEIDQIFEGQSVTHMARITGNDAANITQATISSIQLRITDDDGNVIVTRTLVVADTIFDVLQTTALDARWTKDSTGYNFKYSALMADLPKGDTLYRFEYRFRPVSSGAQFHFVREVQAHNILTTSG